MSYPLPTTKPWSDEDVQPVSDAVKRVLEGLGLPLALGHKAMANTGDFLANTSAGLLGMKRPNPSAMSDAVTSPDTSFRALGEIGDAFNPKPMLRSAFGWEDATDEPSPAPAQKRTIGIGGPSPQANIPRLGKRSPVVIDQGSELLPTGEIPPEQGFGDEPALPASAFGQPQQAQTPGEDPYDLGAMYRKRVAGIPQASSDLSQDQGRQLSANLFLNMLAGNRPGSYFLQNAGRAGLETSGQATAMGDRNYQRSSQAAQLARQEAAQEIGFTEKGQDNRELARHQRSMEDLRQKELDVNKQYREGQIDAKAAELEVRKIQAQMAELRALAAKDRQNPLQQQVETILKYGPKGMTTEDALKMALSKGKSDEDQQIDEAWKGATTHALSNGMPAPSRDQIVAVRKYGGQISRAHPDYVKALKDPSISGDKTKLDAILKTRGLRVVD